MKLNATLVREMRATRGWSQEKLADVSGLNLRTIQRIETAGVGSLRSKVALAEAFDLEVTDLNDDLEMSPCPECRSDAVYQCELLVDTTTIGGELLPKLASGAFSSAKMRAVVCADCGFLRYFVDDPARERVLASEHWTRV